MNESKETSLITSKLPRPLKLEDVLGKFELYNEVLSGIFTKPVGGVKPLTVSYCVYALRSFFSRVVGNYYKEQHSDKKIGVDYNSYSGINQQVNDIIEKIPLDLINEIYNIFTYDLFDEHRQDALTIRMDQVTPESAEFINFLMSADYGKFPGTPLQKAVMMSFIVTKNSQGKGKSEKKGDQEGKGSDEGGDEPLDVLDELGFSHSNIAKMVEDKEIIEKIKPNEFTDKTLSINDECPGSIANALIDPETKTILELENKIQTIEQWSIKSKRKFKLDLKSKKKRNQQMKSMSQINKIPILNQVNPLFQYKLITGQLFIKDRYVVEDEKQLSIVMIDDSGSMSSNNKISWRNAIMYDRLLAVHEKKSDLMLHFYEVDIHRSYILNEESSDKPIPLYNKLKMHSPNGGGTYIERCLLDAMDKASNYISKHKQITHELPVNIIIVCDGQDEFSFSKAKEAHTKVCKETNMNFIVNGIIIGTRHAALKQFCEYTGGKFIYE